MMSIATQEAGLGTVPLAGEVTHTRGLFLLHHCLWNRMLGASTWVMSGAGGVVWGLRALSILSGPILRSCDPLSIFSTPQGW